MNANQTSEIRTALDKCLTDALNAFKAQAAEIIGRQPHASREALIRYLGDDWESLTESGGFILECELGEYFDELFKPLPSERQGEPEPTEYRMIVKCDEFQYQKIRAAVQLAESITGVPITDENGVGIVVSRICSEFVEHVGKSYAAKA